MAMVWRAGRGIGNALGDAGRGIGNAAGAAGRGINYAVRGTGRGIAAGGRYAARGIRNADMRENWPNYLSAGAGIGCGVLGLLGNDNLYAHNLEFPLRALTDIFAGSATGYMAALGSRSALNHTISYFQDMTAHEERGRARHE